jgi:hypothetical protein
VCESQQILTLAGKSYFDVCYSAASFVTNVRFIC